MDTARRFLLLDKILEFPDYIVAQQDPGLDPDKPFYIFLEQREIIFIDETVQRFWHIPLYSTDYSFLTC